MLENSDKKDFKSVVLSHQFLLIVYVHSYTHVLVYNLIKTRSLIAKRDMNILLLISMCNNE